MGLEVDFQFWDLRTSRILLMLFMQDLAFTEINRSYKLKKKPLVLLKNIIK